MKTVIACVACVGYVLGCAIAVPLAWAVIAAREVWACLLPTRDAGNEDERWIA